MLGYWCHSNAVLLRSLAVDQGRITPVVGDDALSFRRCFDTASWCQKWNLACKNTSANCSVWILAKDSLELASASAGS